MSHDHGRLKSELLDRFVDYGHRVLQLCRQLEDDQRPRRLIEQIMGSGTSAGANAFEAHEAVSRRDFVRCLGITAKELHETIFWLRLIERAVYITTVRLEPLFIETKGLLAITKAMIRRTRRRDNDT